ncbi:hypothetical protein ACWEQ3_49595 [Streptomyces mirabilis]
MGKSSRPAQQLPRATRVLAAIVLAVGVLLPFAFLAFTDSSSNSESYQILVVERVGIQYVGPLSNLVTALTDGQSAAVRSESVNANAIRTAVAKLNRVDTAVGGQLAAEQRWSGVRQHIDTLLAGHESGAQAFSDYSDTIDLALALSVKVGDTSTLILDPALDSYHLVDAALVQAMSILVDSGQMADLAWLANQPAARQGQASSEGRIFAARDRVSAAAAAMDADVQTSFDATQSATLASALAGPLDQFRKVISSFAPVTSLADLSVRTTQPDAVLSARVQAESATVRLQATMLDQLDLLLQARQGDLRTQRQEWYAAVGVAAVALGGVGWTLLPGGDRTGEPDGGEGAREGGRHHVGSASPPDDEPEPGGRHRASGASPDPDDKPEAKANALHDDDAYVDHLWDVIDARVLVPADELTRVGRAVQPRRRGADTDAQ